jgi:hypothetical protein
MLVGKDSRQHKTAEPRPTSKPIILMYYRE